MKKYRIHKYKKYYKKKLKPHLTKTWCIGVVNAVFIACMEKILSLYRAPYDADYPVICFDERPCFLIGERVEGLGLKADSVKKEHYEYTKNGSCCLLIRTAAFLSNLMALPSFLRISFAVLTITA